MGFEPTMNTQIPVRLFVCPMKFFLYFAFALCREIYYIYNKTLGCYMIYFTNKHSNVVFWRIFPMDFILLLAYLFMLRKTPRIVKQCQNQQKKPALNFVFNGYEIDFSSELLLDSFWWNSIRSLISKVQIIYTDS